MEEKSYVYPQKIGLYMASSTDFVQYIADPCGGAGKIVAKI